MRVKPERCAWTEVDQSQASSSSLPEVAFLFSLSQLHVKKGNFLVLKAKELGLPV